ncbi:MAG: hypothetical protein QNJ31_04195 [Candidatus Caenarcaniphilales bacterium]|nr:hypothetical protein [Candidatus Caenarcaniphilales bacterium]
MIILITALSLGSATEALSLGEVTYSGAVVDNPNAINSGFAQDPNSVSGNVLLTYAVPRVIAISVFDDNGSNTNNPLLDGEFPSPPHSTFDIEINPTEIGTSAINSLYFEIHSVAFTNAGGINVLLSSSSSVDTDTIQLSNGTNTINIDLSSAIIIDSVTSPTVFPLNTTTNFPVSTVTGRAGFSVQGSFDQSTLSPSMPPGNYTGSLTLTLAAP